VAAGPAAAPGRLAGLVEDGDDFPCADFALLAPLKRSPEYRAIRKRAANPKPADAWQVDGLHYFLFELGPAAEAPAVDEAPVALFAMRIGETAPVSALLVTVNPDRTSAHVNSLRDPTGRDRAFESFLAGKRAPVKSGAVVHLHTP
jgi:hypothetical protein